MFKEIPAILQKPQISFATTFFEENTAQMYSDVGGLNLVSVIHLFLLHLGLSIHLSLLIGD